MSLLCGSFLAARPPVAGLSVPDIPSWPAAGTSKAVNDLGVALRGEARPLSQVSQDISVTPGEPRQGLP